MNKRMKLWLPVCLYAGLIFFLSSLPQPPKKAPFPDADKVAHLFEYAILGFLLARAIKNTYGRISVLKCIILSFILALLYGVSDEFHQYFVPTRTAAAQDMLFDSIGGLLGAIAYKDRIKFKC